LRLQASTENRPVRLNSTCWNLVFQANRWNRWNRHSSEFELHLLESGISGLSCHVALEVVSPFELHLLESGISGHTFFYLLRYNSVWTPLAGIWYFRPPSVNHCYIGIRFELHLLESGISGYAGIVKLLELFEFELHLLESGISGRPSTREH